MHAQQPRSARQPLMPPYSLRIPGGPRAGCAGGGTGGGGAGGCAGGGCGIAPPPPPPPPPPPSPSAPPLSNDASIACSGLSMSSGSGVAHRGGVSEEVGASDARAGRSSGSSGGASSGGASSGGASSGGTSGCGVGFPWQASSVGGVVRSGATRALTVLLSFSMVASMRSMRCISAAIASGGVVSDCARLAAYANEICAPSRHSPRSNVRFMCACARVWSFFAYNL